MSKTIAINVTVKVEKHGDENFAATTSPFAITVYSSAEHKAEELALTGVKLLILRHAGTEEEIETYLNQLNIKYKWLSRGRQMPRIIRESKQKILLTIPN